MEISRGSEVLDTDHWDGDALLYETSGNNNYPYAVRISSYGVEDGK
jgi:hypothetical protein